MRMSLRERIRMGMRRNFRIWSVCGQFTKQTEEIETGKVQSKMPLPVYRTVLISRWQEQSQCSTGFLDERRQGSSDIILDWYLPECSSSFWTYVYACSPILPLKQRSIACLYDVHEHLLEAVVVLQSSTGWQSGLVRFHSGDHTCSCFGHCQRFGVLLGGLQYRRLLQDCWTRNDSLVRQMALHLGLMLLLAILTLFFHLFHCALKIRLHSLSKESHGKYPFDFQ